jgi:predicted CopG family antitoxin
MVTKTPKKVVVPVAMTEQFYEKLNELRGGVSLSDYIAGLVTEHLKKQKPIPPEVVDRALVD